MKRDMDLVRTILLEIEKSDSFVDASNFATNNHSFDEVCYHVDLMGSYGLIDAKTYKGGSGSYIECTIYGLTWDGCDYLDAIRDESIWKKTKEIIKNSVGSTTMALIKEAACMVTKKMIESAIR